MDSDNLPNSDHNKLPKSHRILCIIISEAMVQALHLEITKSGARIISKSTAVAYTDPKQCVIQADQCLANLDKASEEVNKVVFAVNHSWIREGDIADEYKPLLRNITTELSLEALGFIDETEAIIQSLQNQDNPFSGVAIAVGVTTLTFAHIASNQTPKIELVGRSDDFYSDTVEGLARFSKEVGKNSQYLPANIVLASFDILDSDLQEYKQQLLAQEFGAEIRFLQTPVVSLIEEKQYVSFVASAAGRAAAIALGLKDLVGSSRDSRPEAPEIKVTQPNLEDDYEDANTQVLSASDLAETKLSAVEMDDSLTQTQELSEDDDNTTSATLETALADDRAVSAPSPTLQTPTATSFGIPIKSDLPDPVSKNPQDDQDIAFDEVGDSGQKLSFMAKLKKSWREPYQGKRSKTFFASIGVILGLLFVAVSVVIYTYLTASAVVTISFAKKPVSKETQITIDPEAKASDPATQTLAASTVDKTVSDKGSIPTTGVKIVGDKAKGTVTIFNKTTSVKTFNSGTVLKTGELSFILDSEVQVASASVQEKSGGAETKYGQAEAKVTASDIGADYNQEEGVKLNVASFASNTYEASVNKSGISGGASREVRVVAEEDAKAILDELRKSLINKANQELVKSSDPGQYVASAQNVVSEKPKYSFKVGDESDKLGLDLEITVRALTYTIEDLRPLAQAILGGEVPDGFELDDQEPQILTDSTTPTASGSGSVKIKQTLIADVNSFAVPKLDLDNIKQENSGQKVSAVINSLKNKQGIAGVEIKFLPDWIKIFRKNLPQADKIEIETKVP